ncbi:hypothetical protein ACSQ67_003855 [Phaseolus vulgaris]
MRRSKDSWVWKEGEKLKYSVKSAYRILRSELRGEERFSYEYFWSIKASLSMQTVAWRVLLDRLPTRVNMENRGMDPESKLCVLYGDAEGSDIKATGSTKEGFVSFVVSLPSSPLYAATKGSLVGVALWSESIPMMLIE